MGLPVIEINFKQKAGSIIERSSRGIACVIVRDDTNSTAGYKRYKYETDIKTTDYSADNLAAIKRCFLVAVNEVIVINVPTEAEFSDAAAILTMLKYNYVCACEVADQQPLANYIRTKNSNSKGKKYIAVVNGITTADSMYIINVKNAKVTLADTGEIVPMVKYLPRLVSLLANLPMNRSCTYYTLTDLVDCEDVETAEKTLDMLINEGWLCLFNDDGDIRIARGVNSLVTITSTETEDMQKIIIVESMNMIREDIYGEYKNNYVGKYKNHYDNQCLFISAVNGYFRQLQLAEILDPEYDNHSTIDVESQRQAWLDIGRTDAADWNADKVKKMTFKSYVFLQGDIKILDATEDLKFDIGMQ